MLGKLAKIFETIQRYVDKIFMTFDNAIRSFSFVGMKNMDLNKPLAHRVRPKTLEEFIGQEEVLGVNKILYRTIKSDRLSSLILWGPTGCRKNVYCKSDKQYNKV